MASSEKQAEAGSTAPPQPRQVGFWDKSLANERKTYLLGLTKVTVLICLLIWTLVVLYWGSLWKSNELAHKLNAVVIDRDGGLIGSFISNALLGNIPGQHITFLSASTSRYPTSESVEKAIGADFDFWAIIEIAANATARLEAARSSGDASWQATSVITVTTAEARNQMAVNGQVLGSIRSILTSATAQLNARLASDYLPTISGNAAAIAALAAAPQTIASPIGVTYFNARPFSAPVAQAATFVGLIYACILTFNITMAGNGMRMATGLNKKLKFSSYAMMRIFVPLVFYIPLAIMFSLINVPFQLPFKGMGLTYGGGFMTWACITYLGMVVLGLGTEAFLSLVGPPFIGFALLLWILVNVSVAALPFELQVGLYKYGYAMPFHNLKNAYLLIIFNAGKRSDLGIYCGILAAWVVLLVLTIPIWLWIERRRDERAARSKAASH